MTVRAGLTESCFSLSPSDDNIVEDTEDYTISLHTTDSAIIASSNEANVMIVDNDSELLEEGGQMIDRSSMLKNKELGVCVHVCGGGRRKERDCYAA